MTVSVWWLFVWFGVGAVFGVLVMFAALILASAAAAYKARAVEAPLTLDEKERRLVEHMRRVDKMAGQ